ncbi:MAG: HEPN domain-containing protein [Defluviitaleaceae bacterium]|nr:HEPN domain-containing protein [Defluviitaleaceae bacterium]
MGKMNYLDFASSDFEFAKVALKNGFYTHCGRLCQQVIEKYFKHIIERNSDKKDMLLMREHKVHRLYDRVAEILNIPLDKSLRSDLATLSDYYFDKNYPGDASEPLGQQEAEDAINTVKHVTGTIGDGL